MHVNFNNFSIYHNNKTCNINRETTNNYQKELKNISFTGRRPKTTADERMTIYANQILKENKLKAGQQIYIKGDSYYLPFMEVLSREAYKNHSGLVHMDVNEESIEALKKKYNKTATLDYEKEKIKELKEANAIFFEFNEKNDPYKKSKVYKTEAKEEKQKKYFAVPPQISKLFKINPKEILVDALDMKEGQMLYIAAEREHLPFIKKLVNFLYSKNKTDIVKLGISDQNDKNLLLYADDKVLEHIPNYLTKLETESADKDIAFLSLFGRDPNNLNDVQTERILKRQNAFSNNEEYSTACNKATSEIPWLVYYAPTSMSAKSAYPELADNKLELITKAYEDANKINRIGKLKEHIEELETRAQKLNEILEKGYRTFHYISIDPETQEPDGKTDFKITMSPLSYFKAAKSDMPKFNHTPINNIPTEEAFTSPQKDTAEGVLSTTMPLSLNGKIINDIQFKFKNGKIVDVKASQNEDMIKKYIESNENADMLGELAIVANSPIAKMERLFNSTLLDENASCHFALGNAYEDTIKGTENLPFEEIDKYLDKNKINRSKIHTDFMVGGKNVMVKAINYETKDEIFILKNDEFLL